jgi:polar amino acid transport system ATP-binding protein
VVTHAMSFAKKVATEVHVMCDGQIVESGPPAQVFGSPSHAATRELLSNGDGS